MKTSTGAYLSQLHEWTHGRITILITQNIDKNPVFHKTRESLNPEIVPRTKKTGNALHSDQEQTDYRHTQQG
jgi:hypothetical protein